MVERDIVSGAFAPGARLVIGDLAGRYGIGATPIREGLSRLVSRGLIVAMGQRGFRVAGVSRDDLADITETRALIEAEALERSMTRGGVEWEAGLVAAFHRLKRHVESDTDGALLRGDAFNVLHKGFHSALIGGCGSARLMMLHSDLYDQAERYRLVMMTRLRSADEFLAEHEPLMQLALARAARAVDALIDHLNTTLRVVYPESEPS